METIAVSQFRANMMQVLKKIEKGGVIIITSRGKPVAKLTPPEEIVQNSKGRLDSLRKTAIIKDVISPIDEEWGALK